MHNQTKLSFKDFALFLSHISYKKEDDFHFLYQAYELVFDTINHFDEKMAFGGIGKVSNAEIIQYILGEFVYTISPMSHEQIEAFKLKPENIETIASTAADKYLSLSKFIHNEGQLVNKYLPPISSLYVYLNFISKILSGYRHVSNNRINLITDLLYKATSIARCTLDLLNDGFETQAFSSWRTLHECECTLIILQKYGKPAIDAYAKHMQYGLAFRDTMNDKEKQTSIFMMMKEEMKPHNLKSKDIKKFIEYGWLYSTSDFKEEDGYKLNFRDGLEKLAGLNSYASRYEMSSEIIHSTPLLIYSSKQYFYYVTLISLYESFFRMEKVFLSLFLDKAGKDAISKYIDMRNVYYSQLVSIHERESKNFATWQKQSQKNRE